MQLKHDSLLCLLLALNLGSAAAAEADKSQYTLFHPTPREQMRPFSSDQTAYTFSPFTVDAGHVQIEADIVDYLYDRNRNFKTEGWLYGLSTIKLGLCNSAALE